MLTIHQAVFNELCYSVRGPVGRLVQQAGNTTIRTARAYASNNRVDVQTGQYVASFNSRMKPGGGDLGPTCTVFNAAPHAIFIELGTRPHVIRAVNRKALANVGTGEFFGKVVNHPGTRPRHILRDAMIVAVKSL